ncbi:hypothetical protein BG006_001186 [Podila minutissima]|uniref:Uncharacterized protein n=1 Tax=Podila minutissima TaxID=64525 RepID=A0A9P5VP57_9FUNG|nr:hypothetical protein BG006_001186 [Podila minutissima]
MNQQYGDSQEHGEVQENGEYEEDQEFAESHEIEIEEELEYREARGEQVQDSQQTLPFQGGAFTKFRSPRPLQSEFDFTRRATSNPRQQSVINLHNHRPPGKPDELVSPEVLMNAKVEANFKLQETKLRVEQDHLKREQRLEQERLRHQQELEQERMKHDQELEQERLKLEQGKLQHERRN